MSASRKFKEGPHCDRCWRWFPDGLDEGVIIKRKVYCRHCVPAMQQQFAEEERQKISRRKRGRIASAG